MLINQKSFNFDCSKLPHTHYYFFDRNCMYIHISPFICLVAYLPQKRSIIYFGLNRDLALILFRFIFCFSYNC